MNTELIKNLIRYIGDNPSREGLIDTPARVLRAYTELFGGYDETKKPCIKVFENTNKFDDIVIDKGDFHSFCEHHILPFYGEYLIAYKPGKKIIGLSKLARIVDYYAAKLQTQEHLTQEIGLELSQNLRSEGFDPNGLLVIMVAKHTCKMWRGVKKDGVMITTFKSGCFTQNDVMKYLPLLEVK